jgi:hypothetical protein
LRHDPPLDSLNRRRGAGSPLDLAQYAAAIERAKEQGKPARVMIEANRDNSPHRIEG